MTHQECCAALEANARALTAGRITRQEEAARTWEILRQRYPSATGLRRAPSGALTK